MKVKEIVDETERLNKGEKIIFGYTKLGVPGRDVFKQKLFPPLADHPQMVVVSGVEGGLFALLNK